MIYDLVPDPALYAYLYGGGGGGPAGDHATLSNLLWSVAGHTVDTTLSLVDSAVLAPFRAPLKSVAPSAPQLNDVYLDDGTNLPSGLPNWRRYTGVGWTEIGATATVISAAAPTLTWAGMIWIDPT